MGAWGDGVYDNDDAADWALELAAGGMATLRRGLSPATNDGYLERDEVCVLVAAADVVARLKSGGGESSSYAEPVTHWVQTNSDADWRPLVASALGALERASTPANNELYELWADAKSLGPWLAVLDEIRARLVSS